LFYEGGEFLYYVCHSQQKRGLLLACPLPKVNWKSVANIALIP